ncbi:protein dopey-2 [Archocentrus centrarchus]|uniref:protein dopey-2 n=1 Tax=Archocentrus centrarchus TaxID=63155 RepID=UPI0011EA4322|nr:protein dopey-2 [Archocentrus centrarchus]XP_030613761.1 protein dopey-2 [Archocentrus centrarchus]
MDPEELELQNDYRYRSYAAVIEKALRNFESSSEWADLISSLGKLNKALQSNLRYSLLPKRLIIGKRLAQCLHPALPSGVHLKALETYEVIFKIIGTKWLAKDLFIYSSGLFPLLGHAAMAVKPVLLTLYERYYLPLQKALLPSLQAFITGLLPGLEEGLEVYDRTDALLVKLSLLVGQQVFYGALWGSMLVTPMVRLPASVFIVTHFDRMASLSQQTYMLGYDHQVVVKSLWLSLQDSNALVQRNTLEILLYFFPFATCLNPAEPAIALSVKDMITVVSAASLTLLRRDMSLNRRLYAWLLGTDIKGGMVAPHPDFSTTMEEHTAFYFSTYSRDFLVKALINILKQKDVDSDPENVTSYLRPFRIIISLLDKPEIGPPVLSRVLLEVVRAFYSYCREMLGEETVTSSGLSSNQLASKIKENKNASEIIKTVNMLVSSMNSEYLWEYMTRRFCASLSNKDDPPTPPEQDRSHPAPSVSEMSSLIIFLLDVLPLELHADIQSHYLPEMLGTMLRTLCSHINSVCLEDVTQGLRACFKVLSKIQMPVAYMDVETGAHTEETELQSLKEECTEIQDKENEEEKNGSAGQADGQHEDEEINRNGGNDAEPANGVYPTLRSEDSGLGISASPSEQHLPPGVTMVAEENGVFKEGEGVWRRGGSIDTMAQCLQDILAFITTRYLLVQVEDVRGPNEEPHSDPCATSVDQKSLIASVGGREIKDKLTELFTPNKRKSRPSSEAQVSAASAEKKRDHGHSGCLDWAAGYMPRGKAEISEACRQAFIATCHLLLECTTFPVYLSEEETVDLHTDMFGHTGYQVDSLPVWLRSLMTLCCLSRDYNIQHTAVASLLELINHSQSLALVIQDKHRRYQSSDSNPLSGRLQMVTVPPIYPVQLRAIEEGTDFYQRVSQVLWSQLDTERREQHISCVDLFYRLHCLAPSASICEDIICQALLHKDKAVRLEALHRFTVLWHLTREIQTNRTMSLSRSFDRSLCVVVDSLSCTDGSISAAAQCWLVRALSLSDVIRILEPILLLLLHPSTQRCSIQSIKQNFSAGNLKILNNRSRSSSKTPADAMATEVTTLNVLNIVDRESLWAELDSGPEPAKPPDSLVASRSESEETEERDEEDGEEQEEAESEHTESADTSGAQVSTENTSSGSTQYPSIEEGGLLNGLRRVESEHTQASDSLSSEDEEDLELEAMAKSRLLKQEREKREAIDSLFRHVLLYPVAGGWRHLLQGLALLDSLLRSSAECPLVDALSFTSLDTSSAAHLNLVSNLLQRHQQALDGKSFHGCLLSPSSTPSAPPSLLIELLVSLCLRFLRSHYPSYLTLSPLDLQGNREVQVKSVAVLTRIVNQLCCTAQGQDVSNMEFICSLLSGCKVQQYALLTLSASMYVSQRGTDKGQSKGVELLEEQGGLSEESLVNLGAGGAQEQYPLQMELLKLLQALIVLEYHVWSSGAASAAGSSGTPGQPRETRESSPASTPLAREWQTAVLFQQSIKAAQYVQSHPITAQGMFVSAAARALQPQYGYAMHPHWVSLLCSSLPYLGRSLGIIVTPLISQICRNLDELVKLYEHDGGKTNQSLSGKKENIAPDYPLTLLEGLTTITHYCLLDNKRSLVACDPVDVRNARNAVIEALPQMLNSMTLLWGVVMREETQRRASDAAQSIRHTSTSVYFRSTKVLRQRILDFLLPLTGQYGIQVMASLGVVWSNRKSKKRHKNKVLPVASESRQTIVELVKSLSTLHTDAVLHLVKEVVKKPHQIKGEQKSTLVDIPMLQFSFTYIQSISAQALQENVTPLLSLLRESVQLNLAPPGHFLLLGILNDFVNRLPNLDNKKDTRDLQEVTQRILEAVGGIAGSSLEQTSWLSRSLEVKVQPQVCPEAEEPDDVDVDESAAQASTMVSSSAPSVYSVQALVLLAEILAPLLDMVYRSDEKEKAVPLISRLMYYVFPYLKNHSAYNMPSFEAGAQLLSSLSGYAYTKRAWKKEVFELFMDPLFFTMDASCAHSWKSIIDHLLTHEKTMFKDLMSMQSSSLKLFNNVDQKPMLLKRQAFAMFSGELDQYHLYLPLIQERLTETLRMNPSPAVFAQMFLMFRVLLLRISTQHLTSLWPIMVTELIRTFTRLEKVLKVDKDSSKLAKVGRGTLDRNGQVNFSQAELDMYLSACKFLDTSLAFPPERIPLFQMYRWAFVPEVDVSRYSGPENALIENEQECIPHVVRVLEGIQQRYRTLDELSEESSTEHLEFPLLTKHSLSSITQLLPFLRTLFHSFQGSPPSRDPAAYVPVADYPPASSHAVLMKLEHITEEEFLDSMES